MTNYRLLPIVLVSLVFAGCAVQKPQLPEDGYAASAKVAFSVDYCNWKGWLQPETAATGKYLFKGTLSNYVVDVARFNSEIKSLNAGGTKPTENECNQLAMDIHENSRRLAERNQAQVVSNSNSQELINSTKMKNTYCNKIGNQMFCNTF